MTTSVVHELEYLLRQINDAPDVETAAGPAGQDARAVGDGDCPSGNRCRARAPRFRRSVGAGDDQDLAWRGRGGVKAVDLLSNDDLVQVWIETRFGDLKVVFDRLRVFRPQSASTAGVDAVHPAS